MSSMLEAEGIEPVLIKTRNEAVLEGVRPLNLLFEDNNSEVWYGEIHLDLIKPQAFKADEWQDGRALT
ncbi:hypothetical protein NC653_020206 [Populus alba x Populus x berolinensis]|uniref:Uncharacterized protein n=1 Tax=Populus alba x Populus x berolinensis TaxID=444605 RepID=A0AAD6MK06_9ROSI|nr:hypothetical protein NC653_020206 [Populus alba x Populus x berolinensis]